MATASAAAPVAVVQSPQDKRQYKRLRLQNGLDVLLIHDPEMAEALEGRGDDGEEECGYESDDEGDEEDDGDMEEDMADEVRREATKSLPRLSEFLRKTLLTDTSSLAVQDEDAPRGSAAKPGKAVKKVSGSAYSAVHAQTLGDGA